MTEFHNPTAGDMATYFTSLPSDTPFRIQDPDTHWTINQFVIKVRDEDNTAWLTAEYYDMTC
jgi:hypothetical protein